jgi:tRNA U34 5-methylaminomethyl-2-thiouridine-forming methyltransferase MnmC
MSHKLHITSTKDGSFTLYSSQFNEHYHSIHGALQESKHIFIQNGLMKCAETEVKILEIGFGTGLNAWLSLTESEQSGHSLFYTGIEPYPVSFALAENYIRSFGTLSKKQTDDFLSLHRANWEEKTSISPHFVLQKINCKLENFHCKNASFNIIYYDAFSPTTQAELWELNCFQKMYHLLKPGGFLVTYCAKGQVKRKLKFCGFTVKALPGPPGKREMTIALK